MKSSSGILEGCIRLLIFEMNEALTDAGVLDHFENSKAITTGRCPTNFETKVLPFFSRVRALGKQLYSLL